MTALTRGMELDNQTKQTLARGEEPDRIKPLKKYKGAKNAVKRFYSKSIQPLAKKFFQLIREHNHLKKPSSANKIHDQTRKARHACHCRFSKQLLDDNYTRFSMESGT